MFHHIDDFLSSWETESAATQKQIDQFTDESLGQAVADDHRTLGRIAWHLITSIPEMANRTGLKVGSVAEDAPMPGSANEFRRAYAQVSKELFDRVKADWTDQTLQEEDDMYGERWKRGLTLWILVKHEIHHRGQMTVLMRQAGLKVPGFYGPAKEEWSNYGMEAPTI